MARVLCVPVKGFAAEEVLEPLFDENCELLKKAEEKGINTGWYALSKKEDKGIEEEY